MTVNGHAKRDLGMESMTTDSSAYFKRRKRREAEDLMAMLVNDGLFCGNAEFQRVTEATLKRLDSRPRERHNVEFYGLQINTTQDDGFSVHQLDHIGKI